jgi:hypothetical protein
LIPEKVSIDGNISELLKIFLNKPGDDS